MTRRVLIHVQHLLGIGHLRRGAALAKACAGLGLEVTVASGGATIDHLDTGHAALVQLPGLRAADSGFTRLLDDRSQEIDDEWRAARSTASLDLFARIRPHVLVTETFPFGRRQLAFELLALLAAARQTNAVRVSSVRDVLTTRKPVRTEEAAAWAREHFDHVLVHGDPGFIGFGESFPAAAQIEDKIVYGGYVASGEPTLESDLGQGEIIVSAGGGAVGERLLRTACEAQALAGDQRWRLLAGGNLPETAFAALAAQAPKTMVVERARSDFPALLRNCAVSVSQAGYNTVVDVLQAGCRAVLVPFASPGETEQTLRAKKLEQCGLAQCCLEDNLTPQNLADAVRHALAGPPPPDHGIALDGARRGAELIAEWADDYVA
ncbi:MAG: glycosyltransferase [Alphaproteobacteria bacterium]